MLGSLDTFAISLFFPGPPPSRLAPSLSPKC
nr:hypothetical protein [Qipengyuania aquimaris]